MAQRPNSTCNFAGYSYTGYTESIRWLTTPLVDKWEVGSIHPNTTNFFATTSKKSDFYRVFSRHKKMSGKFSTSSLKPEANYKNANFPLF
jgi:hypothetical protein